MEEITNENQTMKNHVSDTDVRKTDMNNSPFVCTVCRDEMANIIFLPCSHMTCCERCALKLSECPKCKVDIHITVRALFS